ncbi:hypothetical protein [Nonomuraea sp. bgisy101]|uniref:hypothetical protein n=1 Tax=Nonomuraea sp. bgisy101 TaxID=3413784 RepID=UPI003D754618
MTQQKSGLVPGILIGLVAMLVGAGVHGAVIGVTEYNLGIVAVLVGMLVGLGMTAVKPSSAVLPSLAALFGLVGAALGTTIGVIALTVKDAPGTGYVTAARTVVTQFDRVIQADPVVALFWVISAVAAFAFVNKRVKAVRAARAEAVQTPPAAAPQEPVDLFTPRNR